MRHPELLEGEAYLCNSHTKDLPSFGWKSKRTGLVAYDIYDKVINNAPNFFPVFVSKAEVQHILKFDADDNVMLPRLD